MIFLWPEAHFLLLYFGYLSALQANSPHQSFLIEEEHYTKSGRWWRAPVEPEKLSSITADNAKQFIESLDWCFIGGSYYDGKIQIAKKPIEIE